MKYLEDIADLVTGLSNLPTPSKVVEVTKVTDDIKECVRTKSTSVLLLL